MQEVEEKKIIHPCWTSYFLSSPLLFFLLLFSFLQEIISKTMENTSKLGVAVTIQHYWKTFKLFKHRLLAPVPDQIPWIWMGRLCVRMKNDEVFIFLRRNTHCQLAKTCTLPSGLGRNHSLQSFMRRKFNFISTFLHSGGYGLCHCRPSFLL